MAGMVWLSSINCRLIVYHHISFSFSDSNVSYKKQQKTEWKEEKHWLILNGYFVV
jgi:hypothetical protein